MKTWLLGLLCRLAVAQSAAVLPPLPKIALQPKSTVTTLGSPTGVRYQYQLMHLDNEQLIWLAPA